MKKFGKKVVETKDVDFEEVNPEVETDEEATEGDTEPKKRNSKKWFIAGAIGAAVIGTAFAILKGKADAAMDYSEDTEEDSEDDESDDDDATQSDEIQE